METLPRLEIISDAVDSGKDDSQDRGACQVATVSEVSCSHHVLRIEHLLSQFWHGNSTEPARTTAGEWCKTNHEEMESRKWNHVDGQFAEVRVKLPREAEASRNTRHDC